MTSSHGFWTKLLAPRRIASTAVSMLPHPVMTTIGIVGVVRAHARNQLQPFAPGGRVAGIVRDPSAAGRTARARSRSITAAVELTNSRLVAFAGQQPAQCLEDVGLVVGDEDPGRRRFGRSWHAVVRVDAGHASRDVGSQVAYHAPAAAQTGENRGGWPPGPSRRRDPGVASGRTISRPRERYPIAAPADRTARTGARASRIMADTIRILDRRRPGRTSSTR